MSELKPCPFCGGEAHIAHQSAFTEGVIICDSCKAMVCFPWYKAETNFHLAEAWNRRVEMPIDPPKEGNK
jgi:Lar family restriction alleviation protein